MAFGVRESMDKGIELPEWQVLVVEDDPLVQLGIEQALAEHPKLTLIGLVDDGYLAIESCLQNPPNLVLMDIGLPGLDGITATQRIKEQLPNTRVIMLTSHNSENEVMAALSSGADAYCIKGRDISVIFTAIAAVSQGALYIDASIARTILDEVKLETGQKEDHNLSQRELDVLLLLVEGFNNTEIADRLFISPNTVKSHMRSLMNKLAVNDRVQVAVKAIRTGLA